MSRPPDGSPVRGRGRRVVVLAVLAGVLVSTAPLGVAAASVGAPPSPGVVAGEPWWVRLGAEGMAVSRLEVTERGLELTVGGRRLLSTDGGRTAAADPAPASEAASPPAGGPPGAERWAIRDGRVLHGGARAPLSLDAEAPDLGTSAHLLAAPGALPGEVVAVSTAGVVWRRLSGGGWERALVLLPRSLLSGPPAITSIAAFAEPLSGSVYLGTDGYGVLASADGGEDWIRFSPGLPEVVLALATDPARQAVYAGTSDGLWVHHLRPLPAVPSYPGPDLLGRWAGTAAITLAGLGLGVGGMIRGMAGGRHVPAPAPSGGARPARRRRPW